MALSPAAITVLTRAAERPDHRLEFHRRLPTVARRKCPSGNSLNHRNHL